MPGVADRASRSVPVIESGTRCTRGPDALPGGRAARRTRCARRVDQGEQMRTLGLIELQSKRDAVDAPSETPVALPHRRPCPARDAAHRARHMRTRTKRLGVSRCGSSSCSRTRRRLSGRARGPSPSAWCRRTTARRRRLPRCSRTPCRPRCRRRRGAPAPGRWCR